MVQHTVCFKLKDNSEEQKLAAKEVLLSMIGKVPSARQITVGTDFLGSARSYDVILQVLLDDREALDVYQSDPYHCSAVKPYMHEHQLASVALDCEI